MKAVIFDMGGVLVDLDMDACRNAFREDLGFAEIDEILDPCHQKGIIGEMEEGLVDADEFREYVRARSRQGVTWQDVDHALYKILTGIAPYKIDMLKRLSENYDLYILSNNNPIAAKRASDIFREAGFCMESGFRKCYLSHEMKMLKPSERFYKAVMDDIGLPADEMIFIDDSRNNVDGAMAAGMPAVYYKPGTDLDALLTEVLKL